MSFQIIRQINFRGEVQTKTLDIPESVLRIGRASSNDLHLEDLSVSQNQAEIICDAEGHYVIRDLTETGKLLLNAQPLIGDRSLSEGDRVSIHGYDMIVSQPEPSGPFILTVENEPLKTEEPSLALMPKLQLSEGRWTFKSLSVWLTLLVLVGSVGALALGKPGMFMPGPVSVKHAKFTEQCEKCHSEWKAVWKLVPDKTCQGCHPKTILSPSHFEKRTEGPGPPCASCHLEHKDDRPLLAVSDQQCVECHGDLKVTDASFPVKTTIHDFTLDHPEFSITRPHVESGVVRRVSFSDKTELKDDAQLKLNHKCHLSPELLGDQGPETLTCESCHRVDQKGQYMQATSYERDCKRCHLLTFDSKLPDKTITHGRPFAEVRQELNEIYADFYFNSLPGEVKRATGMRRLPGQPATREERIFVNERVARAEQFLLPPKGKACLKCHAVETTQSGKPQLLALPLVHDDCGSISQPVKEINGTRGKNLDIFMKGTVPSLGNFEIANTHIPKRWLPYSRFDHAAHFGLQEVKSKNGHLCLGCHEYAQQSRKTSDVLLAGIGHCRTCHEEPVGAQAQCKTCHEFHPKTIANKTLKQKKDGLPSQQQVSQLQYHGVKP